MCRWRAITHFLHRVQRDLRPRLEKRAARARCENARHGDVESEQSKEPLFARERADFHFSARSPNDRSIDRLFANENRAESPVLQRSISARERALSRRSLLVPRISGKALRNNSQDGSGSAGVPCDFLFRSTRPATTTTVVQTRRHRRPLRLLLSPYFTLVSSLN